MIVFLPIKPKPTGGTSTFARKFRAGMTKRGHTVTFAFQKDYDILLASPTAPLPYLLHAKLTGRPIIHRLDGVYDPKSSAGKLWRALNLQLSIIRKFFANAVIYQSKFSQRVCDQYLLSTNYPARRRDPASGGGNLQPRIVYNGVDTNHFTPKGEQQALRDNAGQHIFITASRFRREDQILPILDSFTRYQRKIEPNSKLIVIGDFAPDLQRAAKSRANERVSFLGAINNDKLPAYLRAADVFVFTHQNPPCPNNVIEAMACALPICGIADGSMPELTRNGENSELLPISIHKLLRHGSVDTAAFAKNMHVIMQNHAAYAHSSRNLAIREFQLDNMITAYEHVFQQALRRNNTR